MSPRERNMAILLLALILLFGAAAAGYAFVYEPIQQKNAAADKLDAEIQKKQEEADTIRGERKKLIEMQRRSLPPDAAIAKREYAEMMNRLLLQAKVPLGFRIRELNPENTGTPNLAAKKPAYTKVAYELNFEKADVWAVHDFLLAYYKLDLLHQITQIEVKSDATQPTTATRGRPANDRKDLVVKLITEAIILDGAESRRTLLPVPNAFAAIGGGAGLTALNLTPEASRGMSPMQFAPVLATRTRDYTFIVQNDIFHGPLPTAPSMYMEKIADVTAEVDQPIDPIKVKLTGDLGPTGMATIEAKADGKILPAGSVKVNSTDRTISFAPAKGETGRATVTVVARNDEGKEVKSTFRVEVKDPVAKGGKEPAKLPEISESIRLIIAGTSSDGTATAVIRDNFNPQTYAIDVSASGRVRVTKYYFIGQSKKKDKFYEPVDQLAISDEDASSTKRTFKIVAIDGDGLILADLKPAEAKPEQPVPPKVAPVVPGKIPGGGAPRPDRMGQGAAEPISLIAGAAATSVKPAPAPDQPTLYRWIIGKTLKGITEVPKDEAKNILQRASISGPVGASAVAATGN